MPIGTGVGPESVQKLWIADVSQEVHVAATSGEAVDTTHDGTVFITRTDDNSRHINRKKTTCSTRGLLNTFKK
jgi:hypothetical protein